MICHIGILHNYHNLNNSFYGIETQLIDKAYKVENRSDFDFTDGGLHGK